MRVRPVIDDGIYADRRMRWWTRLAVPRTQQGATYRELWRKEQWVAAWRDARLQTPKPHLFMAQLAAWVLQERETASLTSLQQRLRILLMPCR